MPIAEAAEVLPAITPRSSECFTPTSGATRVLSAITPRLSEIYACITPASIVGMVRNSANKEKGLECWVQHTSCEVKSGLQIKICSEDRGFFTAGICKVIGVDVTSDVLGIFRDAVDHAVGLKSVRVEGGPAHGLRVFTSKENRAKEECDGLRVIIEYTYTGRWRVCSCPAGIKFMSIEQHMPPPPTFLSLNDKPTRSAQAQVMYQMSHGT